MPSFGISAALAEEQQAHLEQLRADCHAQGHEMAQQRKQAEVLVTEIEALRSSRTSLQSQQAWLQQDVVRLEESRTAIFAEVQQLRAERQQARAQIAALAEQARQSRPSIPQSPPPTAVPVSAGTGLPMGRRAVAASEPTITGRIEITIYGDASVWLPVSDGYLAAGSALRAHTPPPHADSAPRRTPYARVERAGIRRPGFTGLAANPRLRASATGTYLSYR